MRAVVAGSGLMGVPLAWALHKLGLDVVIVDPDGNRLLSAGKKISSMGGKGTLLSSLEEVKDKVNVLVSAAPYHQNTKIHDWCIRNKVRYCDLGGNPATSAEIQEAARGYGLTAFTDLGLAPGFSNILAEEICRRSPGAEGVGIRVGGLPVNPTGMLNYARTWSTDGLRNEYSGNCETIRNGQLALVLALSEVEYLTVAESSIEMEAFHTKGGLASSLNSMIGRGVKHCDYKTIRYKGHSQLLKFLIEDCKLTKEDFDKAIANACPETVEDEVFIVVFADDKKLKLKIMHDKNWTAMQKSTAFPAASVTALVAEGVFDDKIIPTYADIPFDRMMSNLDAIGGIPEIKLCD